jgi:protein Mpv17
MMAFGRGIAQRGWAGHRLVTASKVGTHRFAGGGAASSDSAYGRLMGKAPLTTSGLSALALWGAGDLMAQALEQYYLQPAKLKELESQEKASFSLESSRLAGCMTHGFFLGGVGGYLWYGWMDKFVTGTVKAIPGSNKFIAAKLLMEICVWHPVGLLGYWGIVGKFEGHSNAQIGAELRESFLPTLAGDASLWTPIDILNFRYVPVHLQALVINAGGLVEAVALSYIHGLGGADEGESAKISEASSVASKRRVKFFDQLLATVDDLESVLVNAKAQFSAIDSNVDGYLSLSELRKFEDSKQLLPGITNAAVSSKVLEIMIRKAQLNQSTDTSKHQRDEGRISEPEYLHLLQELHGSGYRHSGTMHAIIKMFDQNGDDKIDKREISALHFMLTNDVIAEDELNTIFKELDTNGDGFISAADLQSAILKVKHMEKKKT